jgi:imidazolonepropionase
MPNVVLVRGARQLLTLRGLAGSRRGAELRNLGLIQDGAVLIVDGIIREVGPSRRIENLAPARRADEIDASGCVVMPGFVDCCTHLASGPARLTDYEFRLGGAQPSELIQNGSGATGLARSIQELSFRALESQAMRSLEDAVRHGSTTIELRSGFGLTEVGEMKILRVHAALRKLPVSIISTLLCAQTAPGFRNRADQFIDWLTGHLLPLIKRRKFADCAAIRLEPNGFAPSQAGRFLSAASSLGIPARVHAGRDSSSTAIALAVDSGAASVDDIADPSDRDIARLAQSSVIATLLPGEPFYLGTSRYPAARRLIDQGAAVAIASGYHPEVSPSQNMQMMLALACSSMNMTPAEAISAATINAAHALRRESKIGSLECGKRADLLVLGASDYRELPYHFGVNLVDLVMANGEILTRRSEVRWPAN